MAFFKKSLGRSSGSKLKDSAASSSLPPWAGQQSADEEKKRREEAAAQAEADRRRMLNVNRYAAGGGGAPAFTKMRKQEQSRLEKMQNQTFTRWVNLQLATVAGTQPMQDLVQGLASGENLLRLLAVLSGKNPHVSSSSPSSSGKEVGTRKAGQPNLGGVGSRFQSLGNVELAFKFMKEEGIQLIGIGPQDISQGNLKLILGMLWSIIQHYRLVKLFEEEPQPDEALSTTATTPASAKGVDTAATKEAEEGAKSGEVQGAVKVAQENSKSGAQTPNGDGKEKGEKKEKPVEAAAAVQDEGAEIRNGEGKGKKGKKDDKKEQKLKEKAEKAKKEKEDKKAKQEKEKKSEGEKQEEETSKAPSPTATEAPVKKPAATGQSTARAAQQSVESSLLEWVREKLSVAPEAENLQVRNVKELFADGRALPILVNAIQPGLVDVKALDIKKPVENNKLALRVATEKLAVPNLIEGEDLANGADVDGLSLILYLSYLKQADARKGSQPDAKDSTTTATTAAAPVAVAGEVGTKKEVVDKKQKERSVDGKQRKENDEDASPVVAAGEEKTTRKDEERAKATATATSEGEANEHKERENEKDDHHVEPSGEAGQTEPAAKRPQDDVVRAVATPESSESVSTAAAAADAPAVPAVSTDGETEKPDVVTPEATPVVATDGVAVAAETEPQPEKASLSTTEENGPAENVDKTGTGHQNETSAQEEAPAVVIKDDTVTDVSASASSGVMTSSSGPNDAAAEAAESEAEEKATTKNEGGEGEAEGAESSNGESKGKKDKKEKKGKKEKKTKKTKTKEKGDKEEKKKKKKKKSSSKKSAEKANDNGETSPASVDESTDNGNEASGAPGVKKFAPLPHSRLPTAPDVDLSYLADSVAPVKREAIKLAPIPERKKAVPVKKTEPSDAVDPVSAFWYS